MARKSDELTPRQRQSQQIMRRRASRKKRRVLLRKCAIAGGGLLGVSLLGGGFWAWQSGIVGRTTQAAVADAYGLTARAGFSLQSLYLEGRSRTPMADIEKALGIRKGEPILELSIDDMRQRLEHIESIRFAAVERSLPDTLHVRIVEREPVALWQHQGKITPVDDQGTVMNDVKPDRPLPLIVGDDAPQHVANLLAMLALAPDLARRYEAAVRVGGRRWDIRLAGNIQVKLPEDNPDGAWKKLADLEKREQVLDRGVKVIDLRLPDRLFIKLAPVPKQDKISDAKET